MDDTKLLTLAEHIAKIKKQVQELSTKAETITKLEGPQGIQGPKGDAGIDGKDGRDGRDGKDGINGKDGKDGLDGVSVVNASIAADGNLVLELSDGAEIDTGPLFTDTAGAAVVNTFRGASIATSDLKTIDGISLSGSGNISITATGGGGDIQVDNVVPTAVVRTTTAADQTITAGTSTILDFDTIDYRTPTADFTVSGTGRITANRAGIYAITAGVVIEAAVGALDRNSIVITVNGEAVAGESKAETVQVGASAILNAAVTIDLAVNDIVDARITVNQVVNGIGNGITRRLPILFGITATRANHIAISRVG